METECRFVLLDFGHPMNSNTIKNIINALKNVIALGLTFPRYTEELHFGISCLNLEYTILESESYIRQHYDLFIRNISALMKTMKINSKVTVKDYKISLSNSIEKILRLSQEKLCSQSKSVQIEIAVITKKSASILNDLLKGVRNKLFEIFPKVTFVQNYKIVQIIKDNEEDTFSTYDKSTDMDWLSCSDNEYDLNCFFKDWFLNRKRLLHIILSKDLNFIMQCEVNDCVINPVSLIFSGKYDFLYNIHSKGSKTFPSLGILKPVNNLEIISRIPVNSLCTTLMFGVPRRIYATPNALSWTQSQMNLQIFKELCRELKQTGHGLLMKSITKKTKSELITFHFVTSDGDMLLMYDITPDELYLPKNVKFSKPESCKDDSATSVIKDCIQKIKVLDEYSPKNFSSGLYQYLRNHLVQAGPDKNFLGSFDSSIKLLGRKRAKKDFTVSEDHSKDNASCSQPKKMSKPYSEKELESIHPALLSSEVVKKYRKVNSNAFKLPELGKDYNDNLM